MAFKFEINDSALVVTDTITLLVAYEYPRRDVYFDNNKLLAAIPTVKMYDTNGVNESSSGLFEKPLSDCQDGGGTPFTEATFRDFARLSLGKASSGGSGTGWSGKVEFRADLPVTVGVPSVGTIYLVEQKTTILFGAYTTYQSGLYIRDLNNGNLNDWRRMNVKVKFTDAEFAVVNAADESKQAKFDMSLLTTGTTFTYVWQAQNGTVALLTDIKNLFNSDGTLTANRTINGNSLNLIFDSIATEQHNVENFNVVTAVAFALYSSGTSSIGTTGGGDINIDAAGAGNVKLQGIAHPKIDGVANQGLATNGSGSLSFKTFLTPTNESLDADAFPTFDTAVVLADLNLIITDLEALPTTAHANAFVTETLTPGSYLTPGAATLTGTLTLDGQGISGATFVIRSPAALTPAAAVNIVLIGGTLPENVHFLAVGAIAVGAGSVINGSMISKAGSPTLGAGCTVVGRMLTLATAVSADSSNLTLPTAIGAIDYRSCTDMVMFTGTTPVTNTGGALSYYEGGIASHTGTVTGFGAALGTFTIYPPGVSTPNQNNYLPFETAGSVVFGDYNIIVYVTSVSDISITGFLATGIVDNYEFELVKLGAGVLTVPRLDPDSDDANKIASDADIIIKEYQSRTFTRRNGTLNRWLAKGNN